MKSDVKINLRSILHIGAKDMVIVFRDRKSLAIMLLMPILIIIILGTALGGMFSGNAPIGRFSVAVVDNDKGFLSQNFIEKVLKSFGKELFDTSVMNEKEAMSKLENGKVVSVISIPQGFTKGIESGKQTIITINSRADGKIKASIIESIAKGFTGNISTGYAGAFAIEDEMKKLGIVLPAVEGYTQADMIMGELEKKIGAETFKFVEQEQERNKSISALQYYSAGMFMMFILFGANMTMMVMIDEREKHTLERVIATGVRKGELIIGKFLGLLLVCLLQSCVLILFTSIAYGVYWGGSYAAIAAVAFSAAFAGSGMGMFIAAVSKTHKTAQSYSQLFIMLSTIIGGGMIPIYVMPEFMKKLANITINYWGTEAFTNLMLGSGTDSLIKCCTVLVAMGVAYLAIGILKFRVE